MSSRIYLDNAATSFPKPPQVLEAMAHFATTLGASPGRGAYAESREAARLLNECRERICRLLGGASASNVIFTLNASDALNLALHGFLRPKDHVVTTWLEHNSILRPLNALVQAGGVEQTRVPCDPQTGLVDPDDLARAVRKNTRLIALAHGSNVAGTLQPLADIADIARARDIRLLVDGAQSVGHVPLDVAALGIDFLAFPGHKGLLGPLGTGGLYIRPGLEAELQPTRQGGTGSVSELDIQPDFLPDRFEPGSHNAIGLIGLSAGVAYVLQEGVQKLWEHEQMLIDVMLEQLSRPIAGLSWYGPRTREHRCGVFSVRVAGFERPQQLSDVLEERFGLLTRPGLHCAPLAHRTFGTYEQGGTTRFSFGPFTTRRDVELIGEALCSLCGSPDSTR